MLDTVICQIKLNSTVPLSFMVVNLVEIFFSSFVFFYHMGLKNGKESFIQEIISFMKD